MIYQRGHTWWYEFVFNGIRYRKSAKTRNKKVAADVERAYRTSLVKGEVGINDGGTTPSLSNFRARVFGHLSSHVSPRTLEYYEDAWNSLVSYKPLALAKLHTIKPLIIEEFVQKKLSEGLMPGTVNHYLRTLRRSLRLAEEWGLLIRAPRIRMLPGERQREFVLTPEHYDSLYEIAPPQLRRMQPFLVDTALRITEACKLQWSNLQYYTLANKVTRAFIVVDKRKSKKKRFIPLTERAHMAVLEQKKHSRSDYIFVGEDGISPASRYTVSEQFRECKKKLGWPWDAVLHSTRHTALTEAGKSLDVFSLKEFAGHARVTTTERYVHPQVESLERTVQALEPGANRTKNGRVLKVKRTTIRAKNPPTNTHTAHIMSVHNVQ
jgi:integrase